MGNHGKQQVGQFTFKKPLQGGQQHPNPVFILRIDPDAYQDYRRGKSKKHSNRYNYI